MLSSEHTPSRSLQINDLLNPITPSSRPLQSHARFISQPSLSSSHHRPHITTLPGIKTFASSPSPYHSRALSSPSSQRTDSPRSAGPRTPVDLLNESSTSPRLPSAQQSDPHAHFGLRSVNWTGEPLPPVQSIYNPQVQDRSKTTSGQAITQNERDRSGDVPATLHSAPADTKSTFYYPPRLPLTPLPPSPVGTYPISPTHIAYSGTHHHYSSPTAVVALPHSPYGPHSVGFGPLPYAHPPHLDGRPSLVPLAGMASSAQTKNEINNSFDVTMASPDPSSSSPPGERSSTRLAIRASLTPISDQQRPYVLQLHPTQQPQQHNQKKRSHADANEGSQIYHTERRSSTSSLSSLSPLSSEEPDSVAGGSGEHVDGSVPKSRKKKESDSPTTATSSVDTLNSAAKKGKKSSKKPNGPEGNSVAVSNAPSSSRKGKEKSNALQPSAAYYPSTYIQPLDPYMTMQLGYGVGVVPIREGAPLAPYPYTIPVPMSVAPGMMAIPGQAQPQVPKMFPEMQYARCMSARYKADPFPRCVSCTRRWAGDTCRFQNIRILLRDANKVLMAVGFQSLTAKDEAPELVYPQSWNINLEPRHVERTMATVAKALLPHLMKEQNHQKQGCVVKRQRETDVRATCDTCMTSLFSNSWMCRQCGREACEECFQTIRRLTAEPSTTPSPNGTTKNASAQRALKERHAQSNPFFLSCNRKAEHGVHTFVPVTRFSKKELDESVAEMERRLVTEDSVLQTKKEDDTSTDNIMDIDSSQSSENRASTTPGRSIASNESTESLTPDTYDDGICSLVENPIPPVESTSPSHLPPSSSTPLEVPSWPVPYYTDESLTEPVFAAQWARGTPLVVTGLLKRLNLEWTPSYFINKYGQQSCIVLECQTDANKKVTVGEFFSSFGNYENRSECWKLKDWPPSADFKWTFPELYEDFNRVVPIPNYTRRDGVLNIASHFPSNTVAPDLGPKMYNAYAAADVKDSKGTTRLHMDMADAVNIMCHAERTPGGEPGCAAWDIFRAEDTPKLRSYFKRHRRGLYQNDPIHAQTFYLDPDSRKQLYEEYGVRSFRIYQRPGEAVFIPAGCAHQVCNLSDCIKVACDFVSPENVERCERLTREFRAQNQVLVWKEDVLQLRSMMWFSWLSCRKKLLEWEEEGGYASSNTPTASSIAGSSMGASGSR